MSYQPLDNAVEPDVEVPKTQAPQVTAAANHDTNTAKVEPSSFQTNGQTSGKPQNGNMFRVNFYSRYFDINTEQFFGKMVQALNPFNPASAAAVQNHDDPTELYGFLWINASIIFLMFVSSTGSNLLAQWLHGGKHDTKYEYDFRLLTSSISVFYGYAVLAPLALYVVTTWVMKFADRLSLTRMISIYSYAGLFWVPATVANLVLAVFISKKKHRLVLAVTQWALVGVTGALSGLSIMLKIRPIILKNNVVNPMSEDEAQNAEGRKRSMMLVAALAAAHVAFSVVVKVVFFGIQ